MYKRYLTLLGVIVLVVLFLTIVVWVPTLTAQQEVHKEKIAPPLGSNNPSRDVDSNVAAEQLVFVSDRSGDYEIYIMEDDGSGQSQLPIGLVEDSNLSPSPDGSQIVYECSITGVRSLCLANIDDSKTITLTNNVGFQAGSAHPSWSPDMAWIAFDEYSSSGVFLAKVKPDGTGRTRIMDYWGSQASWSPVGEQIAYRDPGLWGLGVVNIDGTGGMTITQGYFPDGLRWADTRPDWSPDGNKLAFQSTRGGDYSSGDYEIFTINTDGSNVIQLTDTVGKNTCPTWSADGSRIAFLSSRDGNSQIYIMNADGSSQQRLTNNNANDYCPEWLPKKRTDEDLLKSFMPKVHLHEEELYWPVNNEPPVLVSKLYYPNGNLTGVTLGQLNDPLYNSPDSFLDFPCQNSGGQVNTDCNGLRGGAANYWNSVKELEGWQRPTFYGRVVRVNDRIVLQYWFFYYDNPGFNYHEGDWEMIQLVLDSDENPLYAAYSQHGNASVRNWENLYGISDQNGEHPFVFVAKGSHASYFAPGRYYYLTDDAGDQPLKLEPQLIVISGEEPWLDYFGRWGLEKTPDCGYGINGPRGPKWSESRPSCFFDRTQWIDPLGWAEGLEPDEDTYHNVLGKLRASINIPFSVSLLNHSMADENSSKYISSGTAIQDPEYFDNPLTNRRTVILHNVDTDTTYTVSIRYQESMGQNVVAASTSPLTLTINYPDILAGLSVTATYSVSNTWSVSSTGSISLYHGTDFVMAFDVDGDGVYEQLFSPASVEEKPVDFIPPGTIDNLTATTDLQGNVILNWTAPGDDNNKFNATAYDIRFFTETITGSAWVSATQIISPPFPGPPGSIEYVNISGLASGEYYFAVQAVDDVNLSSGISNSAEVYIRSELIFLPGVFRG